MTSNQEKAAQELEWNKTIDKDFERVTREHSNIFDFIYEEPRLAWDGGWVPVCGSMLVAFHVSRNILWPRLFTVGSRRGFRGDMTAATSSNSSRSSPFQKKAPEYGQSKKLSIPQMVFEIGTGFSVGGAVSYMTNDRSNAEETAVAIPLKEGKSRLCDKLCPALIDEYERQWNLSDATRNILKEPTYHDLKVTLAFVRNCQQRHMRDTSTRLDDLLVDGKAIRIPNSDALIDEKCVAPR